MFDNNDIKKLLKTVGHDKVLIIGIDVSKYFHVVYGINGFGDEIIKPFEMDFPYLVRFSERRRSNDLKRLLLQVFSKNNFTFFKVGDRYRKRNK